MDSSFGCRIQYPVPRMRSSVAMRMLTRVVSVLTLRNCMVLRLRLRLRLRPRPTLMLMLRLRLRPRPTLRPRLRLRPELRLRLNPKPSRPVRGASPSRGYPPTC